MTTAQRARAIATGALLGDPAPGRTPWAEPHKPNEVPRTGMSPTTATFEPPAPIFTTVDEIRPDIEMPILKQEDQVRAVEALDLGEHEPGTPPTSPPMVEWMDPADLLIEGRYQRELSQKSTDLIRTIVEGWDWRRFKPPIIAWTTRGFEIIDGQHTAMAAATHPAIDKIPVLVVEAAQIQDRATAFIGHNRDRLNVTPVQMHRAGVAAGDPAALAVQRVIDGSGASLLVGQYGGYRWKPGETIAVGGIDALIKRRGEAGAKKVLRVLVEAATAPVSGPGIKAVDMLMYRPEYAEIAIEHLPAAIRAAGDLESQSKLDAKTHGIPAWEAMGRIWFKKCKKRKAG